MAWSAVEMRIFKVIVFEIAIPPLTLPCHWEVVESSRKYIATNHCLCGTGLKQGGEVDKIR